MECIGDALKDCTHTELRRLSAYPSLAGPKNVYSFPPGHSQVGKGWALRGSQPQRGEFDSWMEQLGDLGDVISMDEGSLGARSIKGARTLVNLGISRDLPPPITEGPGMGGPGHSLV
ncbi:Uncharacterized protein Fot_31768 [Forsythia ovata]|uniref:Uncharacterized protein n=1 Tax=Forsythia ovata TaxID=205694 RepID=A0ABD1T663_9LAMI